MAKFRCKASGNIVEFIYEVDIKSTRRNKGYEEIIEQQTSVSEETPTTPKKAGRPSKVVTTAPTEEV